MVDIKIGSATGANTKFNTNALIYNFGITTSGGFDYLMTNMLFQMDRGTGVNGTNKDVFVQVYNGFGGTGSIILSNRINYTNVGTAFAMVNLLLGTNLVVGPGSYSVRLTSGSSGSGSDTYQFKLGALQLTDTNGTSLPVLQWVEDTDPNGTATTNLVTTNPILADFAINTNNVNFGNYRVGSTLASNVVLTNNGFYTTNNFTGSLLATATASNSATVSGVTTNAIAQGQTDPFTVGLITTNVGTNTGTVRLSYQSATNGTAISNRATWPTNIGSQTVTVSGVGFRLADDAVSTTNVNLGRFHVGYTTNNGSLSGTVGVTNTATADGFSEGLAVSNNGTSGGATVGGIPGSLVAAGASANLTVGLGGVSAIGTNSGTVTLGFQSSGTGTSGFAATNVGTQVVNVIAQGYSGQALWNTDAGGSWNNFDNWDVPGGTPGIDGVLSTNDTATFGNAISTARTVSLNGQSPVLTTMTFSNASSSYTLAQGSGGSITMGTPSAAQTIITNAAGTHTVSAAISLARATTVGVATNSKLSLAAVNGAQNLSKSGSGTLSITGTGGLSGSTTVTGGTLNVNGAISNSAVTVSAGATLSGSGTVGETTIANSATISPGNSPGTLTINGDLNWASGGNYDWQIYDADGPAGTGWDLISVSGILDLSALSAGDKFNINMWSLVSLGPDVSGDVNNFINTQSYRWTIATAANGITNFSTNYFNLFVSANNNADGFSNDLGGGLFQLETQGNNLDIVFNPGSGPGPSPVPEPGTWAAAALLLSAAGYVRWRKRTKCASSPTPSV